VMSKKARKFSSSAILWQGISPLTIFVNMVGMGFLVKKVKGVKRVKEGKKGK
jgi:hypothetical protein